MATLPEVSILPIPNRPGVLHLASELRVPMPTPLHADGLRAIRARQLFRGDHETRPARACIVAPSERIGPSAYERHFNVLGSPCCGRFDCADGRTVQTI